MSANAAPVIVPFAIDPEALRPLIAEVVTQTLAAVRDAEAALPTDRIAFSEAEAARLLGLESHQLRDERLRGRIIPSQIVGKRIRYARADLLAYLQGRRVNGQHE